MCQCIINFKLPSVDNIKMQQLEQTFYFRFYVINSKYDLISFNIKLFPLIQNQLRSFKTFVQGVISLCPLVIIIVITIVIIVQSYCIKYKHGCHVLWILLGIQKLEAQFPLNVRQIKQSFELVYKHIIIISMTKMQKGQKQAELLPGHSIFFPNKMMPRAAAKI